MDDEHEIEGPTEEPVDGVASPQPVSPSEPEVIAAESAKSDPFAPGWTPPPPPPGSGGWTPPPPPPPFAGAGAWTTPPPPPPFPGAAGWMPPPPPASPPGGAGSGAHWVGFPGGYWAASSAPPPRSRQPTTVWLVVALLVIGLAAGFGIGRVAWQSTSTSPSGSSPSSPFGSGTSPFGSGTSPFGSGSFPFGSGSSGSVSSAAGGPSNPAAIASRVDPAIVDVVSPLSYEDEEAAGTGIVLTSNGVVLTNNHVIDGATSIKVTDLGNNQVYTAVVLGYDRSRDIAVLKLDGASGLKVASLGDSSTVRVGEPVVGIGNVGGLGGTPSVAGGSVTALGQSITATEQDGGNPENLTGLIETNADIQAGDSGGPLVNTSGKVVGMDTAASAGFLFQTNGAQGYAIPINSALAIAKRIESGSGSASVHIGHTAFLGVEVYSTQSGSSPSGAVVNEVLSGSPAASVGLAVGDVITSLGGKAVHSAQALTTLIQLYHPGDHVQIGWTDSTGSHHSATLQFATGPAA